MISTDWYRLPAKAKVACCLLGVMPEGMAKSEILNRASKDILVNEEKGEITEFFKTGDPKTYRISDYLNEWVQTIGSWASELGISIQQQDAIGNARSAFKDLKIKTCRCRDGHLVVDMVTPNDLHISAVMMMESTDTAGVFDLMTE